MIKVPKYSYCDIGKRIYASDVCAFSDFFHELYTPVYMRALKVLKHPIDAEDAAQDVFAKLWKRREKWVASKGTFMGWFLTLAEGTIIDAYRKKQRYLKKEAEFRIVSLDSGYNTSEKDESVQTRLERVPDRQPDVLSLMVSDEIMEQIETAVCSVENRYFRLAWILRHLEGYLPSEIAKIMKCSVGTCKSRIHRCQKEIRKILSDCIPLSSR